MNKSGKNQYGFFFFFFFLCWPDFKAAEGIVCRIQRRYTQSKWSKKNKQKNSTRKRDIQNAITYTAHTNKGEREIYKNVRHTRMCVCVCVERERRPLKCSFPCWAAIVRISPQREGNALLFIFFSKIIRNDINDVITHLYISTGCARWLLYERSRLCCAGRRPAIDVRCFDFNQDREIINCLDLRLNSFFFVQIIRRFRLSLFDNN